MLNENKDRDVSAKAFYILIGGVIAFFVTIVIIYFAMYKNVSASDILTPVDRLTIKNEMYELELVKADLETYGTFSTRLQKIILDNVSDVHFKRHIPVGLLHCIFTVESDYRFIIDHPTVTVICNGKEVTTHAIGMGGVVWCLWKDSLIANHIAEKESDLYLPDVNIQASGCILSIIIKSILKDSTNTGDVLDKIIRRYYGAYSEMYMTKMIRVTSELWLKRMNKEVLQIRITLVNSKKKV